MTANTNGSRETGTFTAKAGLAKMLKGGVIMDVVTPEHAKIAEEAGACAVMALERVPADIRKDGGVARMSDPTVIEGIMNSAGNGSAPGPAPAPAAPAPLALPADVRSGWRIHFIPGPKLLRNGNDPLRLLRELATLAPCEVRVDAKWIPPLAELDPEECRLSWRIELNGPVKQAAIKSVFDWVEGECDLNLEPFGPAAETVANAMRSLGRFLK